MKRAGRMLAVGLILWLLAVSFQQAAVVNRLYATVSLRYAAPLERPQVEAALDYGRENSGPYLTFWGERTVWAQGEGSGCEALQIGFYGAAEAACPVEYRYGRGPVWAEPETCAVSTALAWRLWGGENVVGLKVTVENAAYRVVGVFPQEEPRLLCPSVSGFTAAELSDIPHGADGYRMAGDYSRDCGLGEPAEVLWGDGFSAWTGALPWLPLLLAAALLAGCGVRYARRLSGLWRSGLFFGLAFLFALALPGLLEKLPAWLLPTRWSDFDFWVRLGQTLGNRCRDFLSLTPLSRDIDAKIAILKTALSALSACFFTGWLAKMLRGS